jgi:two-component system LytT family response regulator
LRVVLADDEPLARERLKDLLAEHPRFSVVAECASGTEAVEAVAAHAPHLLLLDIRMPGLDGLAVAEALAARAEGAPPTHVVFVTAHDAHALRAFALHALDYLLKPVDADRFAATLARVERQADVQAPADGGGGAQEEALRRALAALLPAASRPARFVVRDTKGLYFVRAADVERVSAEKNYAGLWVKGQVHLVRGTLRELEERLDPERFVRVHRSAIVNLDHVRRVEPWSHGEYVLEMSDGTRLTSSAAHSERLHALLRAQG